MPGQVKTTPSLPDVEEDSDIDDKDYNKSDTEYDPIITSEVPFVPTQCLFCNVHSPTLPANLAHMHTRHGLFLPPSINDGARALAVDAETLVRYLHLVVFGYRECLLCRTVRRDWHAVQQHMMGRGHCRIDLEDEGSEYLDFYEDVDVEEKYEEDGEESAGVRSPSPAREKMPLGTMDDGSSLRLASGKTLSHRTAPLPARPGRRPLAEPPRGHHGYRRGAELLLEDLLRPNDHNNSNDDGNFAEGPLAQANTTAADVPPSSLGTPSQPETKALTRTERRALAHHGGSALSAALMQMSARDQAALVHLSPAERRVAVARRFRQQEGAGRAGSRYRGKLEVRFDKARHGLGMAWNIEVIKHDG